MSDEMTTAATSPEPAEPEVNLEAVDREVANDEAADTNPDVEVDGENEDTEDDPADDDEEVEFEGKKYKLPKELKEAVMRQADYTKKTQEVADARREIEAAREDFQRRVQLQSATIEERSKLVAVSQQISQLEAVDWDAAMQSDPIGAQKAFIQLSQLKDARSTLTNEIQSKEQQIALSQQQELAKQTEQASAVLAKEIPGWGPEKAKELRDFGKSVGFTDSDLAQVYKPEAVKLLYLASLGQKALNQSKTTASPKPSTPVQPAQTVRRSAPATKSPERMSTDEWMRHRNKQVRK